MRVSLIVNIYKNLKALKLIIDALKRQTYKDFEVVICEDGEDKEIKGYIDSIEGLSIVHTTQEDKGVRKAHSQNNGVRAASGEYLIFIDGDCIPYTTFIEGHVLLAEKKCVLSGRRVNLNKDITKKLYDGTLSPLQLEKNYLLNFSLMFDKSSRFEQGIFIHPHSFIYKNFIAKRDRNVSIIGCNFSCWRDDMFELNGFDEDYGESGVSDDVDLEWRFKAYGLKIKSCKNAANMFHLYHEVAPRKDIDSSYQLMYEKQKRNEYICKNGLVRR